MSEPAFQPLEAFGDDGLVERFRARTDGGEVVLLERLAPRHRDDGALRTAWSTELATLPPFDDGRVLRPLAFGEDAHGLWLTRPWPQGLPLARLEVRGWSRPELERFARSAVAVLASVHRARVVHRSLSPEAWWLGDDGELRLQGVGSGRVRNLALGVSRQVRAPEEARGQRVDPGCDVFALGAWLVWWLTGEPLVAGAPAEVLAATASGEWRPIEERGLPSELERLLARATAFEPASRYRDASEWLAAWPEPKNAAPGPTLERTKVVPAPRPWAEPEVAPALETTPPVPEPLVVVPPRPVARRNVVALVVGSLLASSAVAWWAWREPPKPPQGLVRVVTRPPGAQVSLDGVVLPQKAPLTLTIDRTAPRHLTLWMTGLPTFEGLVQHETQVEVDLATGRVTRTPPPAPPPPVAK